MTDMTDPSASPSSEAELLGYAIARLRASVMATTFGLAGGAGMFVATVFLVVRGGEAVGPHLGLLNNYFPGYTVTWPGAFLGLLYGAFVGACTGWILAWVYNRVAQRGPSG